MKKHNYIVFSVACWMVWALIFVIRFAFHLYDNNHAILYIFVGWAIGWLGGMIAHKLYR